MPAARYNALSVYLKAAFGCKVFKVTIDAGRSCPNRDGTRGTGGCAYCDSAALRPKAAGGGSSIAGQLKAGIEYVRRRHKAERFIAYFQINTSTHAPAGELRKMLGEAVTPEVAAIAVSTRPDCLGEDILDVLSEVGAERPLWVELGLQSARDATLKMVGRGHTAAEFADAATRAARRGIKAAAHVIIGLPGEEKADNLYTMGFLAKLPVWGIKFHQLQVLKGTPLADAWSRGELRTLSLEEYAEAVVECLELLPPEMVVHRLSGDAPEAFLLAPRWGAGKFEIAERIETMMQERSTRQGARYTPLIGAV